MTPLRRHRPFREPPILLQILVLLLGGLVIAQAVTLLLTLVLPPAPPVQHSLDDIVAALRAGDGDGGDSGRLVRSVKTAPPDVAGPGWFTSPQSRHTLAAMLGARDEDVRLAFYAPLPFAGIAAPPSQLPAPLRRPMPPPLRPIVWQVSPEPLDARTARLIPAGLILIDQPGGVPGGASGRGGVFPGGIAPGGVVSGGAPGRASDGGFPGGARANGGAQRGDRFGAGRDQGAQDGGSRGGAASPSDLDRQPLGREPQAGDTGARSFGSPGGGQAGRQPFGDGYGGRVPTEGFDPRLFQSSPDAASPGAPRSVAPVDPAPAEPPSVATAERRPVPAPVPPAPRTAPQRAVIERAPAPADEAPNRGDARPIPIEPQGRSLFGLAPAPFVEGDFVAAQRRADGAWVIVQPVPEGFPNAWQRRVMLWFAIAFGLVAPVGWLFARHIVRPLARFTEAAEQLGRDPSAALVALEGPAEIGRAAHAFNVMQNRLRSFVDDRTAMVGAISHDLRTPLTRMRFRIEEVDDDAIRDGMSEEVAEMEAMIASVLTFIRDASTPNARERLDLGLLVEDVAQDATMIGSDVRIESSTAAPVEVDALGMRRLLANLVENAVKYGERARIRLGVDDEAAIAEIMDDGPGVPEDELERAFEPFYRASNAEGSGKTGSGLGLAVCRSIARAHGGDVRLLRAHDGFRVELRLPLAYGSEREAA